MPMCPDASGPNWLILKQKSSAGTQRRTQALSPFKQHCVRSLEGSGHVAVTCRLCKGVMNLAVSLLLLRLATDDQSCPEKRFS